MELSKDNVVLENLELTIKQLGYKLKDPDIVETIVMEDISKFDIEDIEYYHSWSGYDLGNGLSGICCFIAELDEIYPDEGWDIIGHNYLLKIKEKMESSGVSSLSLWGGFTGICFAALALSKGETRYQNFINQLHQIILEKIPIETERCRNKIELGVEMTDYDVIGGLAGIGRYLLYYQNNKDMNELLKDVLRYLIKLTEKKEVNGVKVPGWYIPSENQFLPIEKVKFPNGNFNVGFAHGISGCLALLSIAKLKGYVLKDQDKAISTLANWLSFWSQTDEFGPLWPRRISWEEYFSNKADSKATVYEAWCYGEAGIARSLWLAGRSLKNLKWMNLASNTFNGMYKRNIRNYTLISPTYCHGIAGTLHSVQLMLKDQPTKNLLIYKNFLLNKLLKHIDLDTSFGIKDIEEIKGKKYKFNKPGLLNGSAGVAMVLLRELNKKDIEWDSVFLVK
ncbi:lanthionine synthetase C family protein [Bacillus subtilis]|uniref:lanthionine synthetase C family protein n=1 Tax=Bacillus subtilis TaxID=1423 RepID=UPI002280E2E7|nr:lanthionine synthetase C family protein [Bacillus subtilis]MCY8209680.1 lanthionine synthetase C family protein [Bacillus subtilis]